MRPLGKIVVTDGTSKNNETTAAPFGTVPRMVLQPNADCYIRSGATGVAATADDTFVPKDALVDWPELHNNELVVAAIPFSGTALTVKFWEK